MPERYHIHLDAVGGVAGDMFVASMLHAMPGLTQRVMADIMAVLPPGSGLPVLSETLSGGIAARHFRLIQDSHSPSSGDADHHHSLSHHDGLGTYRGMCARIRDARLNEGTAAAALAIFAILAEAEAAIHQVPVEDVHFHEIGDWDSLMDVVAAGSIAAALPRAEWSVSPLPLGGGMVQTAHGKLPVPAPATAAILQDYLWRDDHVGGERVTPTGAAILRFLTGGKAGAKPTEAVLAATGYGAGTRQLSGMPNVLRSMVFTMAQPEDCCERLEMMSFDIDDMTAEEMAQAADRLRGHPGVLELTMTSGLGKKGRLLTTFQLLVRPETLKEVSDEVFLQTSTLGLRWHAVQRRSLKREAATRDGYRLKRAFRPDGTVTAKIESDDLARLETLARRRQRRKVLEE
ncbi:LarC family nickel insertion protein [Telmatospirillum sp. J64-1]|uniref:LarC family nickel insertion protein n=1 Tax=Telmatospirillum sp. J64-1 TaxID=2502183 RepID=UPI00115CFA7A|nr:LarC family nickel insertion protein [Telmatospirillum sp. J64-1]